MTPFEIALFSILLLLFTVALVPFFIRYQGALILVAFSLSALASLAAVTAGIWTVASDFVKSFTIPMGMPDLPFHLRLDPLSGFFLTVIGLLGFFVKVSRVFRGIPLMP